MIQNIFFMYPKQGILNFDNYCPNNFDRLFRQKILNQTWFGNHFIDLEDKTFDTQ